MASIATDMLAAAQQLADGVRPLRFAPPVTHVYNPLDYAWAPPRRYIERYGAARKRVVLLGMNPGPFGMAQTGVPFGDIPSVRDFLKIVEPVGKPAKEHPQRPILGFDCPRGEVSGTRVWGLVRALGGTPDAVFAGPNVWPGGWAEGRANAYGIAVEELPAYYAKRTLLNETILPEDIANACFAFVGGLLNKSTGNALNVGGGVAMGFLREIFWI